MALQVEYVCPYCANNAPLQKYLIKKADGTYNQKRVKCPLCNEGIKMITLKADMSAYEWGKWIYLNIRVFNSPHFHFYDKWQHDIFFINLSLFSRSVRNDWWNGFKEYKGKSNYQTMKEELEKLNIKFGIWFKKEEIQTLDDYNNMGEFTEVDNEEK